MFRTRVLAPVLLTFALAGSAWARPPGCPEQCDEDPSAGDEIVCTCWERSGAPVITCGRWRQTQCTVVKAAADADESVTAEDEEAEASFESGDEQASKAAEANVCRASS
jgi:hypothetical protein